MENCWEGAPQSSQDYYPHYNLFQSSIFYDTDNFRIAYLTYKYDDCLAPQSETRTSESQESNAEHDDCVTESGTKCSEDLERSPEPPDKESEDEDPEAGGEAKTRIITKEELYRHPDLFRSWSDVETKETEPPEPSADVAPRGYDWTRQSWVKGGARRVLGARPARAQRLVQQLVDAPRVQSSKAETMMQKMGWTGGALGKSGHGILDPVTPDPVYASSTVGFGKRTEPDAPAPKVTPQPPPVRKHAKRDVFRTNLLMTVMEFVKDDTEIELLFDVTLKQHERRHIHTIISHVITGGHVDALGSAGQYELVQDIQARSAYLLGTASQGAPPARYLTLYKEAPEHVYLVTPDDFLPKDDEQTEEQTSESQNKENDTTSKNKAIIKNDERIKNKSIMETDDDENPFLKSIQKSLKKDDDPKNITNKFEKDCNITQDDAVNLDHVVTAKDRMLEFFLEFADSDDYTEMWFLGKFTTKQVRAINNLLNDVSACIDDLDSFEGDDEIANLFKSGDTPFELKEGFNGTTEIHKVSANLPL